LFDTFVDVETPIPELTETGRADALVRAEGVDALELAVVLARRTLVLVATRFTIYQIEQISQFCKVNLK